MPKTKEQKQQEALARQVGSVLTTTLRDLIKKLPGGAWFQSLPNGTCNLKDTAETIVAFGKFRGMCFQHGIKIPMLEDHGSLNDIDFLLNRLTPMVIGNLVTVHEQQLQKDKDRTAIDKYINTCLNDSGVAMNGGNDLFVRYDIKCFKETLKIIKASRDEDIRKMQNMFHGHTTRFSK